MQISMSWLQIRGEWIMVLIWIAISVGAVLVELATPTALISIWFAVGGVIGALTALINLPLWVQIVCFVVVSLASMLIVPHVICVGIRCLPMPIALSVRLRR